MKARPPASYSPLSSVCLRETIHFSRPSKSHRHQSMRGSAHDRAAMASRHLPSNENYTLFGQNIWDFPSLVSVELGRGRHEKAWASQDTLDRVLARVLHSKAARMARCALLVRVLHSETTRTARCPSAHRKTAKTKNSPVNGSQNRCYNFRYRHINFKKRRASRMG